VSAAESRDATIAAARLAAYLMSGSLRYAQQLADGSLAPGAGRSVDLLAVVARCCDDLVGRPPRGLPVQPAVTAALTASATGGDTRLAGWLEPFPDDLYPESLGPAARFEPRETIDLVFVTALQLLPPEERCWIVSYDVLGAEGGPAAGPEAARAAFAAARAAVGRPAARPAHDETAVMMRFIFACESADRDGLRALLAPAATLQSVPDGAAVTGPDACADWLLASGPGLQRLLPRRANGRLAFGVYRRDGRGEPFRAHALNVVTVDGPAVAGIVSFRDPAIFPDLDLLPELPAQGERPA